jgi:hypothetical protein
MPDDYKPWPGASIPTISRGGSKLRGVMADRGFATEAAKGLGVRDPDER